MTTGLTTLAALVATLGLVVATVAGTTTLAGLALRTLGALAAVLRGLAGAGGSLGLVDTIERDLALLVDLDNLDVNLIANVKDVLDLLHAALGHTGDVQQAVLAGKQLDEGAEGLDAHNAAEVLLAHLGHLDDGLDASTGLLAAGIAGADEDGAVLLDVDGGAGVLLDGADGLAARADDLANLVGRDVDGDDVRGVLTDALARSGPWRYQRLGASGARRRP